jgi:predicted AAA+ superfamily ATPase
LRIGGYPEYVLNKNNQYISDLVTSIIYKDIVAIHGIKNPDIINQILILLAERVGYKTSFNKMKNILNVSIDTVREYIFRLEEVYLVYELKKFSYSLNEQIYNDKKYYFTDVGIRANLVGFKDTGSLAENVLFLFLKEKYKDVFYYYEEGKEVDFVCKVNKEIIPIESKYIDRIKVDDISLAGLNYFVKKYKSKSAYIITKGFKDIKKINDCKFIFIPLFELLLGLSSIET